MLRVITVVVVMLVSSSVRAERDMGVELDFTHEVGLFMATHTKVGATVARRFRDRFYVAASLRAGGAPPSHLGTALVAYETVAVAAVVLHPSRRLELVLGWGVGHVLFELGDMDIHTAVVQPTLRLGFAIDARWRIQAEPIVARGYWSRAWGYTMGARAGMEYTF